MTHPFRVTETPKVFGRRKQWNPESNAYLLGERAPELLDLPSRSYTWNTYLPPTNQSGRAGACVGFTCLEEWACRPQVIPHLVNADGFKIYFNIQDIDEYPGSERDGYDEEHAGTSLHAMAKYSKAIGVWTGYLWARTVAEIRTALSYAGPVPIGTEWKTGSMETDSDGYVYPTGIVEGLHATLLYRYNKPGRFFEGSNHWTARWGINGKFRIHEEDLAGFLENGPEICIPLRSSLRSLVIESQERASRSD